jgi:hypothetical protein
MEHLRPGEPRLTLDEFTAQEALQWRPQPGIPREAQMDISYVKSHATRELVNNSSSLDEFLQSARSLIKEIQLT